MDSARQTLAEVLGARKTNPLVENPFAAATKIIDSLIDRNYNLTADGSNFMQLFHLINDLKVEKEDDYD